MKESGLRENCTIRLIERTEEGESRPPSTLHSEDGKTVYMGKALTGIRSLQRKHLPDMQDWINGANLTVENSKKVMYLQYITDYGSEYI